jgi:hypothetical protein
MKGVKYLLESFNFSLLEDEEFTLKEVKNKYWTNVTLKFINDYKNNKKQQNEMYITIRDYENEIILDYTYKENIELDYHLLDLKMEELRGLIIKEIENHEKKRLPYLTGELKVKLYWER